MAIPIIFIHKGDPYYLDFALNQAHFFNPKSDIYLITDTITNRYDFVKYCDLNLYKESSEHFKNIYKHMSTNSYDNELFCFQRWFIIKEFCTDKKINDFVCLDSDLLLYCDVDLVFKNYRAFNFTISKDISPHCCYFSSLHNLEVFCDFIVNLYTNKDHTGRFEQKHAYHLANNLAGGVCDMTAFGEFRKDNPGCAKDLSDIVNDTTFDDNINESDGFEMDEKGLKKIEMTSGIPYGTLKTTGRKIKFNVLHFQGQAKHFLPEYYTGNNLKALKLKLKVDSFIKDRRLLYRVANKIGYKMS